LTVELPKFRAPAWFPVIRTNPALGSTPMFTADPLAVEAIVSGTPSVPGIETVVETFPRVIEPPVTPPLKLIGEVTLAGLVPRLIVALVAPEATSGAAIAPGILIAAVSAPALRMPTLSVASDDAVMLPVSAPF
jgi:hypothetical protein